MDGIDKNDGVFHRKQQIAQTKIDNALSRPGRFDRQIYIGLPDQKSRYKILKILTKTWSQTEKEEKEEELKGFPRQFYVQLEENFQKFWMVIIDKQENHI